MKTKVFLARHGETEWNKIDRLQGSTDIDLSKEGIIQAKYLSEKFDGNIDFIYTSPLKRAVQTAEIIDYNKKIEPVVVKELREINFGEWEGLTLSEILNNFPKEFKNWRNDKLTAPLCGGDLSLKNASQRAKNAIIKIVNMHMGSKILIIAHGGIIKAGLIGIFEWDMTMYHKISLGNTAVCEIDFDTDLNPTIVKINDTSHLPSDYLLKSFV